MNSKVISALKFSGLDEKTIESIIERPKEITHGDYSFPCFILSKPMKKNPVEIAKELVSKINREGFEKIEAVGPYINFFLDTKRIAIETLKKIQKEKGKYGSNSSGKCKTIVLEFGSPNTNKPLHLGHVRNLSIGDSVSRTLSFNKNKVIKVSINNDRGVHICKSMVAYQEFGKGNTPEKEKKKSDHFIGDYYVMFSKKAEENKAYEEKALECLRKWEANDLKTIDLWKKMNKWAFEGFNETYKKLGIKFDKEYYESKIYKKGKGIVLQGFKQGIFTKRFDGAVVIDLQKEGLGEKVLIRPDGTSIYITQELYLAKLRDEEYKMDMGIYVVANEQEYHFKVLFEILRRLQFKFADKLHHLSYGMVELPEGRMKSREGTVVDADDLIEQIQNMAKDELMKRDDLSKGEVEKRSLVIALAALKYTMLKQDLRKNIIFNPKEAIHFEGDTGPYLLYSLARANSIIKKVVKKKNEFSISSISESERKLVTELGKFPEIVENSCKELSPNLIAHYAYNLAQTFNEFYHSSQVIGSEEEGFRLALVRSFVQVMENALDLLGIPVLKEM